MLRPSQYRGGMAGFLSMSLDFARAGLRMPEYVATHTAADFRDLRRSPWASAAGLEGKTFYEVIDSGDPIRRELFFSTMLATEKAQPIKGMFPFASPELRAAVESDPSRPFVVDVGGGHGRALVAIADELRAGWGAGGPKPRLVLEELPAVIDRVNELAAPDFEGVETVAYDMFTPQTVKSKYDPTSSILNMNT